MLKVEDTQVEVVTRARGYANEHLQVNFKIPNDYLNEIFHSLKFIKKEVEDSIFYLGHNEDYIYRGFCSTDNPNGYGGATYLLDMEDGSVDVVTGPWSSRPYCYNEAFNEKLMDVTFNNTSFMMDKDHVDCALIYYNLPYTIVCKEDEPSWIKVEYQWIVVAK